MADEITDDELKESGLLARVRVDYAAAGCTPGSAVGRRIAAAAERRALYEAGMRAVIEHIEKNHGLDECVCTGCLREDLLGEAHRG